MYNWYAVNTGILCPTGWHVPTDDEWKTLEMYLGMLLAVANGEGWRGTDEGGKLKEVGTNHWNSPNTGARNSSGFTGLPSGSRNSSGIFANLGNYGYWWSTTEYGSTLPWIRMLSFGRSDVQRTYYPKEIGLSVRCLRD